MTGLRINDLSFAYTPDAPVLKGLSMSVQPRELVSILGRNGAGKSTLFKCILGLIRNYEGSIMTDGEDIRTVNAKELARRIAYVPQSHYPSFNYSSLDMVLMGAANQLSSIGSPGRMQTEAALSAMEKVGIAQLAGRGFGQISGGEQQLVLMARAILQDAKIWLLDEPLASLDYGNQIRVLKQLKSLAEEGYLIIQSIHNPDQAEEFSDRIAAISDGTIIKEGKPWEVMSEELIKELYGSDITWKRRESYE